MIFVAISDMNMNLFGETLLCPKSCKTPVVYRALEAVI